MLKVNGNMKVEDIFQGLKEVANPEDAIHMKAYMKDQFEFLGVKTPVRRKLSKVFFKKNSRSVKSLIKSKVFGFLSLKSLKYIRLGTIPIVKCNMWCWIICN